MKWTNTNLDQLKDWIKKNSKRAHTDTRHTSRLQT